MWDKSVGNPPDNYFKWFSKKLKHLFLIMSTQKARKILDEVRDVMRLHYYSIYTERTYCEWIEKYIMFHDMNSHNDLKYKVLGIRGEANNTLLNPQLMIQSKSERVLGTTLNNQISAHWSKVI